MTVAIAYRRIAEVAHDPEIVESAESFGQRALGEKHPLTRVAPGLEILRIGAVLHESDGLVLRFQVVKHDPVAKLASIQAPVLLLWGDKDALIPVANAADYQKVLNNAKLVVFPGVGHIPQEEAPEVSLQAIRAFLVP